VKRGFNGAQAHFIAGGEDPGGRGWGSQGQRRWRLGGIGLLKRAEGELLSH